MSTDDTNETAAAKRKPQRPPGLGNAGQRLWRQIITSGKYELRPDELQILEECCRQADLNAAINRELQRDLKAGRFMVPGSQGQPVINPLIDQIKAHRTALTAMLLKLKLPDEAGEESPPSTRSTAARTAADARWGKSG